MRRSVSFISVYVRYVDRYIPSEKESTQHKETNTTTHPKQQLLLLWYGGMVRWYHTIPYHHNVYVSYYSCHHTTMPSTSSTPSTPSTIQTSTQSFQEQRHSLRIGASQVAALAGLHPYQDLPLLAMNLVYQDVAGAALLRQDTEVLGLKLIPQQEMVRQLAQKAGPAAMQAWKEAQKPVQSVQQATQVKEQLTKAVQRTKTLTARERKVLCEEARSVVDTGFGTIHEEDALDRLQAQTGTEVHHRNAEVWEWPFVAIGDVTVAPQAPAGARPRREKRRRNDDADAKAAADIHTDTDAHDEQGSATNLMDARETKKRAQCKRQDEHDTKTLATCLNPERSIMDDADQSTGITSSIDAAVVQGNDVHPPSSPPQPPPPTSTSQHPKQIAKPDSSPEVERSNHKDCKSDDSENTVSTLYSAMEGPTEPPLFSILGSVDGLRDEIIHLGQDNDSWEFERFVVEVKHRMRHFFAVPPLYEQVQAVVYALMYQTKATEIVQVLRMEPENDASSPSSLDHSGKQTLLDSWLQTKTPDTKETKENAAKPRAPLFAMTVSKVRVDDPVMKHKESWERIILPRLRSFVEAVYRIRSDDHKRYRLLLANVQDPGDSTADGWEVLHNECPWLRDCDTAYRRMAQQEGSL